MEDKTFKLPLQFGEEIALPDGRFVSTAIIEKDNQDFWAIYRARKTELKKAGIFIFKENEQWVCKRYRNDNQKIEESMAISSEIKIKAPKGLDYYPYQKAGIEYISKKPSALIADEMGLGKTIQAIGLMNSVELPTVLIVVPASVKINWGIECKTWLVKNRDIKTIENGKDEFPVNPDIVIINYDLLTKFKDEILTRTWSYVIFDECHYLKNPKTARSKVALKIKADRKVALTGTPIPNKPIELQPVAGYLSPNVFGNFFKYAYKFCGAHKINIGRKTVWNFDGATNLDELQKRLRSTIMLRRKKKDVLTELPDKVRQVIVLGRDNYGQELEKEYDTWSDVIADTSSNDIPFDKMSGVRHQMALKKVDHVIEHVSTIDHKVVVFAHHKDVIAGIKEGLEKHDKKVVILTGDMPTKARQVSIDEFQKGDADVFIGSIQASGVGITLTASSHVVFAEMDWVPANMNQAEDRCHRIGQKDSVLVQHIVVDGSIDAKLAETLVKKQKVADKSLDNPDLTNTIIEEISYNSGEVEKLYKGKKVKALPDNVVSAMQECVRLLANHCDGANDEDGVGFNKFDAPFGHNVNHMDNWTIPIQHAVKDMLKKYKRQMTGVCEHEYSIIYS